MDHPNGSPVPGVSTVAACREACASVPHHGCEAVIFDPTHRKCYRKRHINLERCSVDAALTLHARTDPRPPEQVTPLIVDTDLSFDVDDVGALCIAHALHDLGEARLLAVITDTGYPAAAGAASVLSRYYAHDGEVQLGAVSAHDADPRARIAQPRLPLFASRSRDSSSSRACRAHS